MFTAVAYCIVQLCVFTAIAYCIVQLHILSARAEMWLLFAALAHDFSEIPDNTTTEEDNIVRFMCQIESVPKAMISWERNGKPLPHNSRYVCVSISLCT